MKPTEVSALLSGVRKESGNQASLLLKTFADIRKRFKPVMRHYFTELHKAPTAWFAIRLNYARSVATTSIVGHVLGLGDRHTSNILMDNGSGEVVHIDLGIAFDQVCCPLLCAFPLC
jgi:ataxia telangiectasia mutated family protein